MRFPIDSSVDYAVNPANGYGMRMHPVYHEMRMHNGQDFGCLQGTHLYAMADGTVVSVGGAANNGAGGFFIFVQADGRSSPAAGPDRNLAGRAHLGPRSGRGAPVASTPNNN